MWVRGRDALPNEGRTCDGRISRLALDPMLTPATLAILGLSVVATSYLSGVFGMAGGLILLGIYTNLR